MEKEILYNATENFSRKSKLNIKLEQFNDLNSHDGFDGELLIELNKKKFNFSFFLKRRLTYSMLPFILSLTNKRKNTLFISDYIPSSMKDFFREKNLSYIDTSGNAFVSNSNGLFVLLENNKKPKNNNTKSNRAFTKSGLKVLYQFLINNDTVNQSYRSIGKLSGVSIDTVSKVFKELLRDRYLIRLNANQYKLTNKERLLDEWVTLFNKILRPKLKQRNFKLKKSSIKRLLNNQGTGSIGGELGAEELSNYLIAEKAIIYTEHPFIDVALKLELLPNENGEITLTEKFWTDEFPNTQEILANPLLIYADLLDNPTPRNIETAKLIYNKYVNKIL